MKRFKIVFCLMLLFSLIQILTAIPENVLYPLQMMFPYRATEDGLRVVGHELNRLGAYMWTEAFGSINLGEGEAKDVSENHDTVGTRKINQNDGSYNFYRLYPGFAGIS